MSKHFYLVAALCCWFLASVSVEAFKYPSGHGSGTRIMPYQSAPYVASLRKNGEHICSGTILSRNFILTAARCVGTRKNGEFKPYDPKGLTAYVGNTNRLNGGTEADVEAVTVHKKIGADIALLQLSKPLDLSPEIKPIRLGDSQIKTGSPVTVLGWGLPRTKHEAPKHLEGLTMSASTECKKSPSLLCLGYKWQNSICNADAGGPVTYKGQLVGVATFRERDCGLYRSESFTNVAYYADWIKHHSVL